MRLLLRLDDGAGSFDDRCIELAEDATVGELADHLAEGLGIAAGRTLVVVDPRAGGRIDPSADRRLPRTHLVAACGPRSGSTVRLTPTVQDLSGSDGADPDLGDGGSSDDEASICSPVRLVAMHGPSADRTPPLAYGVHDLHGARVEIRDRVELASTGSVVPTVDGERVRGSRRLHAGDLVTVGDAAWWVDIRGPLRPPPQGGPQLEHPLTPVVSSPIAPTEIELPAPPDDVRLPGFPVLSATVPLLMGAALWWVTRSPATVFFVLFSFVFVVASGLESRREARAEHRFRITQFHLELDESITQVEERQRAEQRWWERLAPDPHTIRRLATSHDRRVWERSTGDESAPMVVRLGRARQHSATRVRTPLHGRRDLRSLVRERAAAVEFVDRACTVDLDAVGALALVGAGERRTAVARSLVAQLVTLLPPDELRVVVLAGDERRDEWRWTGWLPHVAVGRRTARTLVVVDDAGDDVAASTLRRLDEDAGVRVLWLATVRAGLPSGVGCVAEVPEDGPATLTWSGHEEPMREVRLEVLDRDGAEPLARALAPLVPRRSGARLGTTDPATCAAAPSAQVALTGVLPGDGLLEEPDVVRAQWEHSRRSATLGAPVGVAANGVLHVDLRLDGPHTLIAGTTGSGKSELLRTLIASLALHHPPDRLTFLLLDYKGGAAFGPIAALPHTVGLITDLGPQLAHRALVSLRAEVRHREARLHDLGWASLSDAPHDGSVRDLPPALVVVVDEFATLARELPTFVDGLVDVAQRGRSLGIHLVLATQRPAGVVTEAIRANTGLRIALRVADDDDSRDVVEVPDAARLARTSPGSAILRTGPGRVLAAQLAWSSGPCEHGPRARSWQLGEPEPPSIPTSACSQLERALHTVRSAFEHDGHRAPRRPWVDPLPEHLELADVQCPGPAVADAPGGGPIVIGVVDRPDRQRRDALELDLAREGSALVLGASRSGRTTALVTIAAAAVRANPGAVRVHAIDGDGGLEVLRGTEGVGDVVASSDVERVLRLLRLLAADLDRPSATPGRLLLLDGAAGLEELHARLNRGEALDLLTRLARDGRAAGVHLVVAASRRIEVPPALAAALGWRLILRSPTEDDAVLSGLPASSAAPDTPAGRGHVRGEPVQIAWPHPLAPATSPAQEVVGSLPRRITRAELDAHRAVDGSAPWGALVCGVEGDHLRPAVLDLSHQHGVVAGPPRSGRTTTLATLAQVAAARGLTTWQLAAHGPASSDPLGVLRDAASCAATRAPTLVLVDDLPELLDREPALESALAGLYDRSRDHPVRLVLSGEIDALGRCYAEVLVRVRSGRTGILLRPDPDLHGTLLHTQLGRREELPEAPGRGWMVGLDGAVPIQVALAD